MSELKCIVVTPEQTELDVLADAVTVPLFDGEMGILKGHSPLVGRLGCGVLRVKTPASENHYFVEGGLVQVVDNTVSVLTDRMFAVGEITRAMAEEAMKAAVEMPTDQKDLAAARDKALARARAMQRVVKS